MPSMLFFILEVFMMIKENVICMCLCLCSCSAGIHPVQKKVLGPLKLELPTVMGGQWDLNVGILEK